MELKKTEFDAYEAGLAFACAYRELKETYEMKKNSSDPSGSILIIPMIANGCMSVELYLKYLAGSYARTHKFSELKNCVSANRKVLWNQIESMTINLMKNHYLREHYCEEDFQDDLMQFDNAFCEWRYFFEYNETAKEKKYDLEFLSVLLVSLETVCKLEYFFSK